jgi:ABC-type spermidine/putrescine transport system permease subunit II
MSLAAVCAWSFLRSAAVALFAALLSQPLANVLVASKAPLATGSGINGRERTRRRAALLGRGVLWGLLLAPFLVPPLLVGYAYYRPALMLVHYPRTTEAIYWAVLFLRFFAAAVLIRVFAPPSPLSAEAIHCQRLLRPRNKARLRRWAADVFTWLRGPGQPSIAAFAVIFLSAFQEFEIAALMGITAGDVQSPASWTVWLFNWQAGGAPLSESLTFAMTPLFYELVVIVPALILLGSWMSSPWRVEREADGSVRARVASEIFLIAATLVIAGGPSLIVFRGALRGLQSRAATGPLLPEIGIAAAIASTAVLLIGILCAVALGFAPRRLRGAIVSLLCLPGALGSLVLSMGVLWLFQQPGLQSLSQSLVPVVLAVAFVLLPRSLILTAMLGSSRRAQAAHCARMLAQSPSAPQRRAAARLIDELEVRRFFWAGVLVWYWAYWELTAPSILAPPAATPFVVRMYNFMHYRQDDPLSVMIVASILVPLAAVALLAGARRFVVRWVLQ